MTPHQEKPIRRHATLATVSLDILFLISLVLAPWLPIATFLVLGGLFAIMTNLGTVRRSIGDHTAALPPWWFVQLCCLPFTTWLLLQRGRWSGADHSVSIRYKLGVSALLISLGALAATQHLDGYVRHIGLQKIEDEAHTYLISSLTKSSATLLAVATINGAVSVMKSFRISVGVGISLGEVLDPLDDLIEYLSFLVFVSTTSIAAQLLLMQIGNEVGLSIILTAALVFLLLGVWHPDQRSAARLTQFGRQVVLLAFAVRFLVPVMALAGATLSRHFLEERFTSSQREIDVLVEQVSRDQNALADLVPSAPTPPPPKATEDGLWTKLKRMPQAISAVTNPAALKMHIASLKNRLSNIFDHLVWLLAVFLLETLFVPLLSAWALIRLLRHFGRSEVTPSPISPRRLSRPTPRESKPALGI